MNKLKLTVIAAAIVVGLGTTAAFTPPKPTTNDKPPATLSATQPVVHKQQVKIDTNAQALATVDAGTIADYRLKLDGLKSYCNEPEATTTRLLLNSLADLKQNNVTDETAASLITHVEASIPDSAKPTSCGQLMAAYLVMREPSN
ncbi:MAG: hypothetical protein QFB87_04505 [Patescibacteria group bacterium]|nr:hypothetical protein [Patescibacteria group bacterium]